MRTFILIVLLSILPSELIAQNRKAKPKQASPFLETSFDLNQNKLSPEFLGHDYQAIASTLLKAKKQLSKSEFESESDYVSRLEKMKDLVITGNTRLTDKLVFAFSHSEKKYNAESQMLTIRVENDTLHSRLDGEMHFNLLDKEHRLGSYVGQNAFGVKARVKVSILQKYLLSINNFVDFGGQNIFENYIERSWESDKKYSMPGKYRESPSAFEAQLPIPKNIAETSVKNIHALLICSLQPPFIQTDEGIDSATITSPYQVNEISYTFNTKLVELWIWNYATGQVYAKIKPTENNLATHVPVKSSDNLNNTIPIVESQPQTLTLPSQPKIQSLNVPEMQRVSSSVLTGKAINKVQPTYSAIAKAARAQGAVQVAITVSKEGQVISAEAVGGHPLLKEAAVTAAKQWTFETTELSGQPVKIQGILTFNFELGEEDTIYAATDSLRPIILHQEQVQYTEIAKQNRVQGTILVSAVFTANGRITQIRVIRGLPDGLNEQAIKAAEKTTFKPALIGGKPVSVRITMQFNFTLL